MLNLLRPSLPSSSFFLGTLKVLPVHEEHSVNDDVPDGIRDQGIGSG